MLKKKLLDSYNVPTIKAINIISSKKFPDIKPIGSYIFKFQKYPGDIDMREKIIKTGNPRQATKKALHEILKILNAIKKDKNAFLGDFKAGGDSAFDINIGKITPEGKIIGYDYENVFNRFVNLYKMGVITKKEFNFFKRLIKKRLTVKSYIELWTAIKKLYKIRWEMKDAFRGYKILPGGRKKYLVDAMMDKEIVKLDVWYWLNNRYIEISNFIMIYNVEKGKQPHFINTKQESLVFELKKDVRKYLSRYLLNNFKAMKRIWILAVQFKDKKMLNKLSPLMEGDLSILYQIVSDMVVLYKMFKKINNIPYKNIATEIQWFKSRLAYIYQFNFKETKINKQLDHLYKLVNRRAPRNDLIVSMKVILDELFWVLNKKTIDYARESRILPIPIKYYK